MYLNPGRWFSQVALACIVCAAIFSSSAFANEPNGSNSSQQSFDVPFSLPFPMPGGNQSGISIPLPLPGGVNISIPLPIPGVTGFPYQSGGYPGGYQNNPYPYPGGYSHGPFPGGYQNNPYPYPGGYSHGPSPGGYQNNPYPYSHGPSPGYQNNPYAYPGGYSHGPSPGYQNNPYPYPGGYSNGPSPGDNGYATTGPRRGAYPPQQHDSAPVGDGAPSGYQLIRQDGRFVRFATEKLPVRVYSADPSYDDVVLQAISQWNAAGEREGIGKLFMLVDSSQAADYAIDWTGSDLPPQAAGACAMVGRPGEVRVGGISIDTRRDTPRGNLTEQVMHEMGHSLGLDHSQDERDIMYGSTHRHSLDSPGQASLTGRDRQIVGWLYRQTNCLPIVAQR